MSEKVLKSERYILPLEINLFFFLGNNFSYKNVSIFTYNFHEMNENSLLCCKSADSEKNKHTQSMCMLILLCDIRSHMEIQIKSNFMVFM